MNSKYTMQVIVVVVVVLICFFLSPLHMVRFCYPCIGGRNPIRLSTKVSDLQSYSSAFGPLNSLHHSCLSH